MYDPADYENIYSDAYEESYGDGEDTFVSAHDWNAWYMPAPQRMGYDEFRRHFMDERQHIQKKTFTKWINSHLMKTQCSPVNDLFEDLRDGNRLLALLSVLTQTQLKPEKGRMRVHHINNLNKVLNVIQKQGVKLVNISSDDIVAGNPKLTLGLIWLIALEFNGQHLVKSHSSNGVEKSLLAWARQYTEPHGLALSDFSTSWSDGRAFLMILAAHLPCVALNSELAKHPLARLHNAFNLAHRYYKIEKLLDPEDVHTHKPDNKSIQMYVMCLYHAMESMRNSVAGSDIFDEPESVDEQSETSRTEPPCTSITDLDEVPLEPMDVSASFPILDTKSHLLSYDKSTRPLSTATNASVEINSYQTALEGVLTLLLEDEQLLSRDVTEPHDFQSAKVQFHENEHFMLKLTEHQEYVGEALEEGSNLINESQKSSGLSVDDQNEVRQQMVLLNERWETLRLRALDVQAKTLRRLAEFQTQKLDKLRQFLTSVEDRISHMSDIGPSVKEAEQQLKEARRLKDDLNEQQDLVDSLSNMVVIVNDESGNFNDLEDKLCALGERWSHVVKWSDLRVEKLQQYKCISLWLDAREQDLKHMESKDVVDLGSITKRMNDLNYCAKDLLELQRYLVDLRQMVAATLQDGDDKGERVLIQLESFEDRLDALKQIVEVQTERIETKGFRFGRDRASYDDSRVVRPEHWVDYQLIIRFGEEEDDDDEKKAITSESDQEIKAVDGPLASKKRKLRNTDNNYLLEGHIMDHFNYITDAEDRLQQVQRQSLRNQCDLLKDLESEVLKRAETVSELKILFEVCEQEAPGRNLIAEASNIKLIDERYAQLKQRLAKQQIDTAEIVAKEKFYNSLTGFKLVLADSRDWYQQHAGTATKQELEQRLSDMESLTTEIALAKETTATLSDDLKEWKEDFYLFYDSWHDMKQAIQTLIQQRGGANEVAAKLQQLHDFQAKVAQLKVRVTSLEVMQAQQQSLNQLVDELEALKPSYDYIQQHRAAALSQELVEAYQKLPEQLSERVIKQTTAIENLNHFTAEYNAIIAVLRKLEAQLKQSGESVESSEAATHDLRKLEIDVISARNFSEIIIKDAEVEHRQALQTQIKALNELYEQVVQLQRIQDAKHSQMATKSVEIFERLQQTEQWLLELETNTPKTKISEINNSNELFQIKCKFQTLKETCERETVNFRELNELGADLLLQMDELKTQGVKDVMDIKNAGLAKKFTRLNARWTEVTSLVYAKTALLEHISTQLGEFKKFVVSETGYLDRLENKIRSTPENADAEEIIEELDDLENVLRAHSDEWLDKIQEIGNELIDSEFMESTMRQDIERIVERWTQLEQKAKLRTEILEKEVSEAEQSEKCIVQFEAWLTRVDEILSDHLENDVTIEDLPDDFQRLANEFVTNEGNFKQIEELITEHTQNGKTEAANRLQEQLNLMELRFKACQMKLNKCTAPQPAYESRLNRAVAELRNVERSTLVLDVASAGPTTVQGQYQKCLQIYRTLSEIKAEIESTIKTGRKVCEDKFTKSPKQLSQRIDALKHLYNALGENVTQSKAFLEGLLKLARQLQECFDQAESLIRRFESPQELQDRNSVFLEFEDVLQRCEDIYTEYGKSCDQSCMSETRQRIDVLKATYTKLTSEDIIKRLSEMKSTLQNLDNISLDTLKAMEHDLKQINVPSNPEIKNLQQQVIDIVVETLKTRFNVNSILLPATTTPTPTPNQENSTQKSTQNKAGTTTTDDNDTEIVIVSDTVRQRRARTPQSNEQGNVSAQSVNVTASSPSSKQEKEKPTSESPEAQQVLPDLLPPQTFRLAESSTLFSDILHKPFAAGTISTQQTSSGATNKRKAEPPHARMVEIKVKNIQNDKMSVQNIALEPHVGEIVDTVNILESVEPFVPEYVETVQIVDLSEDSDSSMRIDVDDNEVRRSKSKRSLNETTTPSKEIDANQIFEEADEVELRPGDGNTSTPFLRVEKQRISFDEKRKRIETERDILRDSEEDDDGPDANKKSLGASVEAARPPKAKRWRQLQTTMNEAVTAVGGESESPTIRDSFYSPDKETSFDVEPLVFSDDEDIPRFSLEMTPTIDSDSDTSRIETPSTKKSNQFSNKVLNSTPLLDDSNVTIKSPTLSSTASLELRVQEFDKNAKHMIRKLEVTKAKIEQCSEGESAIEDLKMLIAPDAATLISHGDSLVLETHGKTGSISRVVMRTQIILREKFREVQQAKPKSSSDTQRSTVEKISVNIEELVTKGLKRINVLIEKPVNFKSSVDLEKRMVDVNDRSDDLKVIVSAIGKNAQMPKVSPVMMNEIEKTKNNLVAHADSIEFALTELKNGSQVIGATQNGSKDYNNEACGSGALAGSFDKSVLQISDWLTWEQNMIKIQSVAVDDVDGVRLAIEKQEKVLRELKMKKPQLNELVHTAEVLKGDVKRQALQEKELKRFSLAPHCSADLDYMRCCLKVTRLREHWDETSQCVLQRAAQLKNMLGDSQRYETKRLELEKWLTRMEQRAERMGTVATTADILEAQQKEQKSFHAELHQNKQQFELFNGLTQKLIAVYPSDDTSRIKKMTEAINLRFGNLNNGVINRGKQLHAAVHSLQSFDRAMDQFLAWLSESESLCENAEAEIERNPLMYKVSTSIYFLYSLIQSI